MRGLTDCTYRAVSHEILKQKAVHYRKSFYTLLVQRMRISCYEREDGGSIPSGRANLLGVSLDGLKHWTLTP